MPFCAAVFNIKAAVLFISIESDAVTLANTAADRRQPL